MMRRSCSEGARFYRLCCGLALLFALALPGTGLAHPELEAQIDSLTSELGQSPDDAELLLRRADLHRRHGDLEAARDDLDAAARLAPPPELDFYRGRLLLDAGDAEPAEQAFSAYLAARPNHLKALSLRAEARIETGRFLEASDDLAQVIAYSENPSPDLFRRQAAALVQAGEPHWPAARRTADQGLARFPGEVSLLGIATDLSLAMNDPSSAEACMDRLPAGIENLPRWKQRRDLLRELAAAGPIPPTDLQDRARRALAEAAEDR